MGRRDDDEREDGEADAPETAFPEGIDAKTTEAGGEVSMSLEETNRVREKLGLKPLRTGESDRAKRQREAEEQAHTARRDAEKSKETAEIAARIAAAKEKRQMEARNRATAQLGEADDAEDDLSAWVTKSRDIELKKKLEAKRKAEELARKLAEQDDDFEDSESDDDASLTRGKKSLGDLYTSDALAGLRVRHGADEVAEGETVVLTLKDASVLDETRTGVNDEGDELENVLLAEEKRRKRARAEATKRPADAPFAEEDENDKTRILGKYDEKKDDDVLTLNDAGSISAAEERRKAEIRRRLAASLGGAPAGAREQSAATEKKTLAEFLTPAEVAAREAADAAAKFNKPKKKRRKKLREKKLDVDELEGDALVPAASELGSRRTREEEGSAADAAAATDRWRRDAQFAAALTKAKRRTDERILAEMAGDGLEEEEDDELERALARSRRAAAENTKNERGGVASVVAAVAERRAKEEAEGGSERAGVAGGVVFSDTQEFVQNIDGGAPTESAAGDEMDAAEDEEMPPAPPPPPPGVDADADADCDGAMPPPPPPPPGASPPAAPAERVNLGGIGEASTASKGLAATLALLKDTGKLGETEMWDGRTNDKKPLALQRAREAAALPSGEHEGKKFDFNLDKYDEFGRKMTPKEAFRDLCHKFHGIEPSKNKKEKRLKQYQEEMKQKKLAEKLAEEGAVGSMESMKRVQQVSHSPFLMLDGKLRAGQSSNAEGGFAGRDEARGAKSAGAAGNEEPVASRLGAVGGKAKVAFQMSKPKR
jgi:U4/U6.U5 tri-snRNP-associated protein 1